MPIIEEKYRRLASVEEISELSPILNADAILQATVRNWKIVVKIGEFNIGDRVVYFEIDSALPTDDPRFNFLEARGVKTENGKNFHILKTARLRGVYSQGLVLPLELFSRELSESGYSNLQEIPIGTNLTSILSINKWEAPISASNGETAGAFPTIYVQKTDAERIQNISPEVWQKIQSMKWIATEKIDGTSVTVIRDENGEVIVCSRNLKIREGDNLYWNLVRKFHLDELVTTPGDVIQLEAAGEGVQKNRQGVKGGVRPFIFNVVKNREIIPRSRWSEDILKLSVPELALELPSTVEEAILQVDGLKSTIDNSRLAEGVVWHSASGEVLAELENRSVFKVISNKYLLKN